jgi:tetrahydrodipicolinate N-succinyltransferase
VKERLDSSEATMMESRVTASGAAKLPVNLDVGGLKSEVGKDDQRNNSGFVAATKL